MINLPEAEYIKGFSELPESAKDIFKGFLNNYYKGWKYPEDHEVIKVYISKEEGYPHSKAFIKVECINKEWLHVKANGEWY